MIMVAPSSSSSSSTLAGHLIRSDFPRYFLEDLNVLCFVIEFFSSSFKVSIYSSFSCLIGSTASPRLILLRPSINWRLMERLDNNQQHRASVVCI